MGAARGDYLDAVKDKAIKDGSLTEVFFYFYSDVFTYHDRCQKIYKSHFLCNQSTVSCENIVLDNGLADFLPGDLACLYKALEELLLLINKHTGAEYKCLWSNFNDDENILGDLIKYLLTRDFPGINRLSCKLKIEDDNLLFIAANLFKPLLKRFRESYSGIIDSLKWQKPYCPFCGFYPDMSKIVESRKGARIVHCALCEYEWDYGRLKCAVCGSVDPEKMGYLISDDYTSIRLDYCDECKGYIKTLIIPASKSEQSYDLTVENILTGGLDFYANKSGYKRP